MRIRLKVDVPVEPRHGIHKGREFDVLEENGKLRYEPGAFGFAWMMGDADVEVKLWGREFEIVEDGDE